MIEYINGKLIDKKPTRLVVDTNGISYEVFITLSLFDLLPESGENINILTHLHIKENPITPVLYGFSDFEERECFRNIISVSGVGPRTALSILSGLGYKEFNSIILSGEVSPLTSISGIGKKTSERLLLELKDKISRIADGFSFKKTSIENADNIKVNEVLNALVSLGYNKPEAENMVRKLYSSPEWKQNTIEDLIKKILRGR